MEERRGKYISLKEAEMRSGYTSEYLGRLARTKKIRAKKESSHRSWLVHEEDVLSLKKKGKKESSSQEKRGRNPFKLKLYLGGDLFAVLAVILVIFGSSLLLPAISGFLLTAGIDILALHPNSSFLYPATCVGTWQNPSGAEGEPRTVLGSLEGFSEEDFAAFSADTGDSISCGSFQGEYPENIDLRSVTITPFFDSEDGRGGQGEGMQLSYSFDGASWMLIGKVHGKNSSFSIPGITMASELKDVWFRLSGDPSVAGKKSVYLDALRMEIEFERLNGGTENLPAVLLQDSSITFASGRKDFLSNETPRFLIRDPQIELPQIESLVFEGRAEITKDRKGNLQRAVAFRKNSIEKGGGGSQSLIEKVKEKLKEILPKDVPPGQEKKQDEKDPGKGTPPESPGPPAEVPQPSPGNEGGQGAPLKDKEKKEKVNFLEFFRTGVAYAKSANATRITAVILDWRGQNTDIVPEITSSLQNGQKYFDIAIPTQGRSIQPGRYTLRVEIQTPSAVVTSQQDFTWGVLALNVNKSIYAPGEEAYVQIGVLDDAGHTICDAGLELALTSPTGSVSTFSTDKGTIEYSTECGPETVTNTPDYFAFYGIRSETGVYEMSLTAVTANGTRSVADRFEVRDSVAFEVERTGPTRIYPLELYPMTLSVVAHEVFEGTVEERVPSSFVVFQPRRSRGFTSVRDEGNEKVISWDVSLAAGDSIQLGYLFDAPDVSPAFYLLGPLKIGSFQEIRQWQVAGDIVSTGEVVPNGDITTGWAVVGGTSDGTCAGGGATHHCDRIDEARATPSTTDYVATGTAGSTGEVEEYDMTTLTLPSGATVTNITLWMYAQSSTNANGGTLDNVDMNIRIAGSLQTAVTKTPAFGTYQWHSASFSGSWTQANLDGFRSQFTRIRQGSGNPGNQDDDVRIATVYAVATYQYTLPPPSVTQEAYIFENDDGVDADGNTAHAAGNTALTNVKKGERLVLRTHLKNTTSGALDANVALFYDRNDGIWTKVKELQAAITAAGNCTDTNYDCTTVDSTGDVGDYTSIAIDQKGNPWVSYWDFTNSSLKVASYVGQGGNCFSGAWNCETIETGTPNPGVGQYTSIAFSPSGQAWISYLYSDTTDLRVATYVGSGGNCDLSTAWNCTTVDGTATTTGLFTSIAFSPSGQAWISYFEVNSLALKVATYVGSGGNCSSAAWNCSIVDDTGTETGNDTSIAFDSAGNPWVSYQDVTNTALRVATKGGGFGTTCTDTAWTCGAVDNDIGGTTDTGQYTSIAFSPIGQAWVSYWDATAANLAVKVATYVGSGGNCTSAAWNCSIVDNTGTNTGEYGTSITFDFSGRAWVSYNAYPEDDLRVARYVGGAGGSCTDTAWNCGVVDNTSSGYDSSIAFAPDGQAWISYYGTGGDLKVANIKRGGEITIAAGVADANGASLLESHADITSPLPDATNRDDADCITGGANWNNGKWLEKEEGKGVTLPSGDVTPQCTEVAFVIDTSQAQANTTYRFVIATKDSFRKDKGVWRGPSTISQYPTLTIETSTTARYSKDNTAKFTNCTDTSWGCVTVDSSSVALGEFWISLALDKAGNPWVSYYDGDSGNLNLKVAHYVGSGGSCSNTAWDCVAVDTGGNVGSNTAIAVDQAGNVWVSYRDATNGNVKVATNQDHPDMAACAAAGWDCVTVDSSANVGFESSIAIDLRGNPWISYWDSTSTNLKAAWLVGGTSGSCSSTAWNCVTVDSAGTSTGEYSSIALNAKGEAWISYCASSSNCSSTTRFLKVAHYVGSGGSCSSPAWDCVTVDSSADTGRATNLAFDPDDDTPWVVYYSTAGGGTLRVANYVGTGGGCTSTAWNCADIQSAVAVEADGSIAFDKTGTPWVSFYDDTGPSSRILGVARYVGSGGSCSNTAWTCTTVDSSATNVGEYGSRALAFDGSGVPWVAYRDVTNADLKVAKLHLPPYKNDSRYVLDVGKSPRTDADGTCSSNTDKKGYCGAQTNDTHYDGVTALLNQRPLYTFAVRNTNNTATPTATWVGQSTIAPSTNAITMQVYRFGTTNAWENLSPYATDTCAAAGANTDCTIADAPSGTLSEYYEADGSNYWIYFRVWQAASATLSEIMKTDAFSVAFASGGITVSGTVYQTDESSALTTQPAMKLAVGAAASYTTTALAGGTFSFTSVTAPLSGDILTIWLNTDAGSDKGTLVFKYGSSCTGNPNCTGLSVYQNRVIIESKNGTSMANSNLAACDNDTGGPTHCGDTDIGFTSESGVLTLTFATNELHVATGVTLTPGGNATAQKLHAAGTYTGGSELLTLTGSGTGTTCGAAAQMPLCVTGTYTASSNTTKFTGTSASFIALNSAFNNLSLAPVAAPTYTLGTGVSQTLTVAGTLTIGDAVNALTVTAATNNPTVSVTGVATIAAVATLTPGTGTHTFSSNLTVNGILSGSANGTIVVNGNAEGTGSVTLTGGTFEQRIAAGKTFGTTSGANPWQFVNLTFSNSTGGALTVTTNTGGSGGVTVTGILLVSKTSDGAGTVLNAGNRTWTLSHTNSAKPFNLDQAAGSLTATTSTFAYTGNNGAGDVTVENATYNNLTLGGGSAENYVPEGAMSVASDLTINANGTLAGTQNVTVNGNVTGAGTITLTGGTFEQIVSVNKTFGSSSGANPWTFSGLKFNNSDGAVARTITPNAGTGDVIVSGTLTLGDSGTQTITFDNNAANDRILDINGSLLVSTQGILLASNSASFTLAGNFTNNGVFTHNSGTLTVDGAGTSTFTGSGTPAVTFYNLISTTGGKILAFTSAKTFKIDTGGKLTIQGVSGNQIHIHSTDGVTQWLFDHQGTESVQYAGLEDSGCAGGTTNISLDTTSTDEDGNNGSCWLFPSLSFTLDSVSKSMDLNSGNIFTSTATTTLTVTARSEFGYELSAFETDFLRHTAYSSVTIADWTASPSVFDETCIANSAKCGWGYNTNDADLTQFVDSTYYARFSQTAPGDVVAKSSAPVTGDVTTITYRTSVSAIQQAGPYQTIIRYITTPRF